MFRTENEIFKNIQAKGALSVHRRMDRFTFSMTKTIDFVPSHETFHLLFDEAKELVNLMLGDKETFFARFPYGIFFTHERIDSRNPRYKELKIEKKKDDSVTFTLSCGIGKSTFSSFEKVTTEREINITLPSIDTQLLFHELQKALPQEDKKDTLFSKPVSEMTNEELTSALKAISEELSKRF